MSFLFTDKYKKQSLQMRGFTLVETLVSTMIITLVILGPLTLASNASSYARLTKDTLIATYLAQESIELLRHQQDSVYIRCIQATTVSCTAIDNETPQEVAWRTFKARLGSNGQGASCYFTENPTGCSYDFIDMTSNQDYDPTKYASDQTSCDLLALQTSTSLYVCNGARGADEDSIPSRFSRSVSITSISTITGTDEAYNDDLRVTVTITFKMTNGYTRQLQVVDFLHARA